MGNGDCFDFTVIAFADLKGAVDVLVLLHTGDGIGVFTGFGQGVSFVLLRRNRFTGRISHGYGTALGISEFNCSADRNFRQRQRLCLVVLRNGIAVKRTFTDFKAVQLEGLQVSGGFALGIRSALIEHIKTAPRGSTFVFLIVIIEICTGKRRKCAQVISNTILLAAADLAAQIAVRKCKGSRSGVDIANDTAAGPLPGEIAQHGAFRNGHLAESLRRADETAHIVRRRASHCDIADAVVDGQCSRVIVHTIHITHQTTDHRVSVSARAGNRAADTAVINFAGAAVFDFTNQCTYIIEITDAFGNVYIRYIQIHNRTI